MDDEAHQASIFQSALQLNGTSELGLKSHWESEFADDLHQFLDTVDGDKPLPADFNDDREVGGHCWFGIDVARRMVDFIASYCTREDMTIVDIGTGNGDVIFRLAETLALKEIKPQFVGVDYCEDAIRLCQHIATTRMAEDANVKWIVDDAFKMAHIEKSSIDILLDKGMLDAVSMNGSVEMVIDYVKSLSLLGKPDSLFCITSGNFTVEELNDVMKSGRWSYHSHVKDYPTFEFGGVVGTHVRTVVYKLEPSSP